MATSTASSSRAADTRIVAGVALGLSQVLVGVFLVVAGVGGMVGAGDGPDAVRTGLVSLSAVFAGLALVVAPWWWRLTRELAEERRVRIRTQEKAEVAAHIHDSVLQTLALIQRNSADSRTVSTLARQQERELRSWLYGTTPADSSASLAAVFQKVGEEVEDLHGVAVDTVGVGDCPMDERLAALIQSTREALTNAARHSGAASVSAYLEVEPDRVTIFVRDRGRGFDPVSVPDDRRGIAESILGRMDRSGGSASIRSTPAEGTEVELVIPR